jgi:hypothetical protein
MEPLRAANGAAHKENGMAIDQVDQTVVTGEPTVTAAPATVPDAPAIVATGQVPVRAGQAIMPAATSQETVRTESRHLTPSGPGGSEMARRIIVLLFGLIQIVIGLRIVLLLLDARTGNALVSGILDVSKIFVAPFDGILNSNALTTGGSTLDVAAVVAFVGWTILELIVLWAIGIFRREPA